jgi:3-oxoacyl-[acyl-carrier-protein] synthase II
VFTFYLDTFVPFLTGGDMTNRRVVVTGTGAVSALGQNTAELWSALLAGRSGIRRLQRLIDAGLPITTGGEVTAIPYDICHRDKEMAQRAINEALKPSQFDLKTIGFVWSTGLDIFQAQDGNLILHRAGSCFSSLAAPFGRPKLMIATACASGTQAIGEAYWLIKKGRIDACIAGGSSVILTLFYVIGFSALQVLSKDIEGDDPTTSCRPFDKRRRGFTLAEGAGALLVESLQSAKRRNATILAEIIGFGVSQDAYDLNSPPDDGAGACLCLKRTLEDGGLKATEIDAINAHGTGTRVGDRAEAAAIRATFSKTWTSTPVSSIKGAIGHAMSAAGALEAIVALKTCSSGIVPPTVNLEVPDKECELDHVIGRFRETDAKTVLSTSFGMGGQNCALIFRRMSD